MCGIFALLNPAVVSKQLIDELQKLFMKGSSRGPDNSRFECLNGTLRCFIGFHRLAINGLNSKSNQPFYIDNTVLLCNGEIYNSNELCKKYNIKQNSDSDCECIIHLYRKFGFKKTLELIDGVFAMILIDYNDISYPTMYISRDPFGVRPLFIGTTHKSDSIVFSSLMKQIDRHLYNIKQFEPGTWSTYNLNTYDNTWKLENTQRFYEIKSNSINLLQNIKNIDFNKENYKYCNRVYKSLCNAVKKRVHCTDRPIACLLSGGLDSSLITALVCKYCQTDTQKMETFSIGMQGSEDLLYARKVANHLKTKHHEIVLTEQEFLNTIPKVIYETETYDTTTIRASVGNYLVANYIKNNSKAKVIFNGDGSDEVTGGYLYFHHAPNYEEFNNECIRLLKEISYFDVLRSDRCISSNGLEARTPFLDKDFVNEYLSIPLDIRFRSKFNIFGERCEKFLLRESIEKMDPYLLPKSVLWRTKEAFSDGVSKHTRSWHEIIKEYTMKLMINTYNKIITPEYYKLRYEHYKINTPETIEQFYYRVLYNKYFSDYGGTNVLPHFWMPKFIDATDASARTLNIYKSSQDKNKDIVSNYFT